MNATRNEINKLEEELNDAGLYLAQMVDYREILITSLEVGEGEKEIVAVCDLIAEIKMQIKAINEKLDELGA